MKVRVRLFGFLAEKAGTAELSVEASTAGEVMDAVRKSLDVPKSVRIAVNTDYAPASAKLKSGDIVSLIPPVAGG